MANYAWTSTPKGPGLYWAVAVETQALEAVQVVDLDGGAVRLYCFSTDSGAVGVVVADPSRWNAWQRVEVPPLAARVDTPVVWRHHAAHQPVSARKSINEVMNTPTVLKGLGLDWRREAAALARECAAVRADAPSLKAQRDPALRAETPVADAPKHASIFDAILDALYQSQQPCSAEQLAAYVATILTNEELAALNQKPSDWGSLAPQTICAVATALASFVNDSQLTAAKVALTAIKRHDPVLHALVLHLLGGYSTEASVPPRTSFNVTHFVEELLDLPLFDRAKRILRLRVLRPDLVTPVLNRLRELQAAADQRADG